MATVCILCRYVGMDFISYVLIVYIQEDMEAHLTKLVELIPLTKLKEFVSLNG